MGGGAPAAPATPPPVYATGAEVTQKKRSQLLEERQRQGLASTQLAPRPAGQLLGQNGGIGGV